MSPDPARWGGWGKPPSTGNGSPAPDGEDDEDEAKVEGGDEEVVGGPIMVRNRSFDSLQSIEERGEGQGGEQVLSPENLESGEEKEGEAGGEGEGEREPEGGGGVEENVTSAPDEATVVEISPRMQEGDRRSRSPRARAGAPSAVLFALTVGEKYTPATPPVPRAPQVCSPATLDPKPRGLGVLALISEFFRQNPKLCAFSFGPKPYTLNPKP